MIENNEETTEISSTDNSGEGVQPQTITELDRADQVAERQTRANVKKEELLDREEALEARRTVGGLSEGGIQKEPTKKLTDEEYTEQVMSGNIPNDKE